MKENEMTKKQLTLVNTYLHQKENERTYAALANDTLKTLSESAPHKVGEIIKWVEHKEKNTGTLFRPHMVALPPKERKAVCTKVGANIYSYGEKELCFKYEFKPITKNGEIGVNQVYPNTTNYVWTGEVYKPKK